MSHGITLNFVSLAALAAALPYLSQTPGLAAGDYPAQSGNVGNQNAASNAASAATASAAPVAAPAQKVETFAQQPQQPSISFDQVKAALMAYNARDNAAFGAAMQKFGFNSFDAIQAAPGSWVQLMQYIGADTPATPAPTLTIEKVSKTLQTWAQINGAVFQQAMIDAGLTSMADVEANPGKWAELIAAAAAAGVS